MKKILILIISIIGSDSICRDKYSHLQDTFNLIYQNNFWHSEESISGTGSTLEETKKLRDRLNHLLKKFNIKSVLDLPCGDFNWMKEVKLDGISYIGADIVQDLINKNNLKYAKLNRKFLCINAVTETVPKVDLIICRDLFVHFSHDAIKRVIKNFKKSGGKYLLTTSYPNSKDEELNKEIYSMGIEWRPINLQKKPFNFPKPKHIILEGATDNPRNKEKSLVLWALKDIK